MRTTGVAVLAALVFLAVTRAACAAPWIAPDWGGKEPHFAPGSLFWKTGQYPTCPVLFRTVLRVADTPLDYAGFVAHVSGYAYVFVNGRQVAAQAPVARRQPAKPLEVELTGVLRPGPNVLIVSTKADGLSLDGGLAYEGGRVQRFGTSAAGWKVQKLAPLTMLEYQPCMKPSFDDSGWFPVKEGGGKKARVSDAELRAVCERLAAARLAQWDEDAAWRLHMLATKGIAIVDWEAHGWGGAGRLPGWVVAAAEATEPAAKTKPGALYWRAEALTRFVVLSDEATDLANLAEGYRALGAPAAEADACEAGAKAMRAALAEMERAARAGHYQAALAPARGAEDADKAARRGRLLNDLNWSLDNKFTWFDDGQMMGNDIAAWGLSLGPDASVFASPLSPGALVTVSGRDLTLSGWDKLEPLHVYKKPAVLGPVALWAVLGGKVRSLKPKDDGVVYDRAAQGPLTENWVLLPEALNRGGRLPVEMVFLDAPERITFVKGEKGTGEVRVTFARPGARVFLVKPLKEWRGFLAEAEVLAGNLADAQTLAKAQRYTGPCRLWSRALLDYPVTFSEAFVHDPDDPWALRVADVYDYRELKDAWGTPPVRLAPLPPLATYGMMVDYPGLRALGDVQVLGSRGIWGDEVDATGKSLVTYRVPLDPIKRFGGFTAYCFGPTDIGGPGSLTEIKAIKRTGANSFRPQHNQTGEPAMKTLDWCVQVGLQNVFNIDEKWVPDAVEHYRTLAEECKGYPPDAVAYDLLNEPETRDPRAYNALIRKITAAIRAIDRTHLIYVEVIPPWGPEAKPYPKAAFEALDATGDPLTCYSFHDYEYRLPPRWPNDDADIRSLLARWVPAFRYSIDHRAPIQLGEFGAFEQTKQSPFDNRCALTMMSDYLRIFDEFGWHWEYYSDRGTLRVRADGSLRDSYVQDACRRDFARGVFNVNRQGPRPKWSGT